MATANSCPFLHNYIHFRPKSPEHIITAKSSGLSADRWLSLFGRYYSIRASLFSQLFKQLFVGCVTIFKRAVKLTTFIWKLLGSWPLSRVSLSRVIIAADVKWLNLQSDTRMFGFYESSDRAHFRSRQQRSWCVTIMKGNWNRLAEKLRARRKVSQTLGERARKQIQLANE